jgi:hypothetical protein
MIKNGYTSRNIPSPKIFETVYQDRIAAKRSGDKNKANALKLILNTTYGASLAATNPLYDPLMGRSICISGQLYLLELAQHLYRDIPDLKIVALNTDGIMIEFDDSNYPEVTAIIEEWQERTGFELEEDKIRKLIQSNVNNYVMVFENGKVKTKGSYVTYGVAGAGAFSINNNHTIVKKAVIDYFVNGTPVEDTILACEDIHEFQIIAKAGGGYKSVFRVPASFEVFKKSWQKENKGQRFTWGDYIGPRSEVQRVNRVYASKNPMMGALVKIKPDGTVGKIGGLPDSVIIDNKNKLTLDAVDKSWYIALAKKYISDYLGEATT